MLIYTIAIWIAFLLILQCALYLSVREVYVNPPIPPEAQNTLEIAMGNEDPSMPDYSASNYKISKISKTNDYSNYFSAGKDKHLVWNKPVVFQAPLIVPSLVSLKFAGSDKTLSEIIRREQKNIVQECTAARGNDTRRIAEELQNVNNRIVLHDQLVKFSNIRKKNTQTLYNNLKASKQQFKNALQIQCHMTADNSLMECWHNNVDVQFEKNIYQEADQNNWTIPKSFKINNFKDGKVFACKCSNAEVSPENTTYQHQRTGGLIVVSEYLTTFSTLRIPVVLKNWKVFSSNNIDALPDNWYRNDYDDSNWKPPVGSSSAFYLQYVDRNGKNKTFSHPAFKIWGGQNQNKYVWFRYKER